MKEFVVITDSGAEMTIISEHDFICKLSVGGVADGEDVIWCPKDSKGRIILNRCRSVPPENEDGWIQVPIDYQD